jgi:cysteine peptidase B
MRAVLVLCLAAVLATARSDPLSFTSEFAQFKAKFQRHYASAQEETKRFKIFVENLKKAAQLEAANPKATFGVNEYADYSPAEFKKFHDSQKFYQSHKASKAFGTKTMSAEAKRLAAGNQQDWRSKGAVTPIKNQGQCGSCWAFSTTGGIEGQWFLAGNKLTSLSEQELTSCDTIDSGCQGGLMDNAFTWLLQAHNGSIVTEASYPYVSGGGNVPACQLHNKKVGATISGFQNVEGNEDAMAAFVYSSGPLSIGVDATSWQTYTGGIMTNCQSTQVDHGVLIVGFDDTNQPPYWIIKNSWGVTWGENGYIRVQKGTDQCLITSNPCTSEVKKAGPTPPPSPPPSPSGQTFTQRTCIDRTCQKCTDMTFNQNTCIVGSNGSYVAQCITDGLIVNAYASRDCSGNGVTTVNPINTCSIVFRKTGDERFVQNLCTAAPTPAPTTTTPAPGPTTPAPPTPAPTPAPPTPAPTFPSGWVNLFTPPYANAPTIMMAIAAVDDTLSYVPGGENGAGFTAFSFNNQENGVFTPMNMPDMCLMILGIATGGSATNPKGVVGGIGIGNGVQYFANTTTVLPSKIPTLMVQTQDIRMSRNGLDALVVDGMSNTVLYSADSGMTFNEKPINSKLPAVNCTGARYAAMPNAQTYYVTLGNWPANSATQNTADELHLTAAMSIRRGKDGKPKRSIKKPQPQVEAASSSSGGECNLYTAAIAKTTDGGNTWTTQVSLSTNFYYNGVDCSSATHCVAVGEGFNENAGGHIWLTEDGTTWKQVFFAASGAQGQYSFMSVRFSGPKGQEVWVGGSLMVSQTSSLGIFYHSADGGKSWKEYPHGLPNIGAISSIDFLPTGTGVATALTIFDDSTILRYDAHGPPPPGYFIQSQCLVANCSELCQNVSFPQDTCMSASSGGAIAKCTATALVQDVYQTTDCTGAFTTTSMPLDQCLNDNGSYFMNFCPKNSAEPLQEIMPPRGKKFRAGRH